MSELYHHGVKGMHWGVRKAPEVSSAGAGTRALSSDSQARKQKSIQRLKTAAKIGGAVAGASLLAYGAYKLSKAKPSAVVNNIDVLKKLNARVDASRKASAKMAADRREKMSNKAADIGLNLAVTKVTSGHATTGDPRIDNGANTIRELMKANAQLSAANSRVNAAGSQLDDLTRRYLNKK